MKLHEFLVEAKKSTSVELTNNDKDFIDDILEVSKIANAKARKYLDKYTGPDDVLYRGASAEFETFKVERVRKNRYPKDSSRKWHNLYNKVLSSFDNNPKWRSNSLFVTTDENIAADYGEVVIVVPIGDFKMLSAERVNDLYGSLETSSFHTVGTAMYGGRIGRAPPLPKNDRAALFKVAKSSKCFTDYLKIVNFHSDSVLKRIGVKKQSNISFDNETALGILTSLIRKGFINFNEKVPIDGDFLQRIDVQPLVEDYLFGKFDILNELDKIDVEKPLDVHAMVANTKDTVAYAKSIGFSDSLQELAEQWLTAFAEIVYDLGDDTPKHKSEIMLKCDTYIAVRKNSIDRFNYIRENNGIKTSFDEKELSGLLLEIIKHNPRNTDEIVDMIMK